MSVFFFYMNLESEINFKFIKHISNLNSIQHNTRRSTHDYLTRGYGIPVAVFSNAGRNLDAKSLAR